MSLNRKKLHKDLGMTNPASMPQTPGQGASYVLTLADAYKDQKNPKAVFPNPPNCSNLTEPNLGWPGIDRVMKDMKSYPQKNPYNLKDVKTLMTVLDELRNEDYEKAALDTGLII